jgi:transcriptional regulator with XRE-family HTH domain
MRLKIKEWMALRNVSQAQIAEALNLSRATVSAWVEGRALKDGQRFMVFPDPNGFQALCLFFECTPSDMLELEGSQEPNWRDFQGTKRGKGRPMSVATALARAKAAEDREDDWEAPFQDEPANEPENEPQHDQDDVEEVVLFPDLVAVAIAVEPERPVQEAPRSSDELLGIYANAPLASLREWLAVQHTQTSGLLRRAPTLENKSLLAAHTKVLDRLDHFTDLALLRGWLGTQLSRVNIQLRDDGPAPEVKAMQLAYTRALNKLDYYAQQD